ncbi:MAG: protein phosphatase 2C domain-containing protein [Candidatus Nanoperiomorbaceae bacterium]
MSKDNLNGQDKDTDGDWTWIDGEATFNRDQLPILVRFGLGESAVIQVVELKQRQVAIIADDKQNNKASQTLRPEEEVPLGRSHPRRFGDALNDSEVSRIHAWIGLSEDGENITVGDFNSLNGTWFRFPNQNYTTTEPKTSIPADTMGKPNVMVADSNETDGTPNHFVTSVESIGKDKNKPNQDTALVDTANQIFAVLDGVGGDPGGDVASRRACKVIAREMAKIPNDNVNPEAVAKQMRLAFIKANTDLLKVQEEPRQAEDDLLVGETTATAVKIHDGTDGKKYATVANAGDSRAYILRDGQLTPLTIDNYTPGCNEQALADTQKRLSNTDGVTIHSLLVKGAPEASEFRLRNLVYNALGFFKESDNRHPFAPQIVALELKLGDRIILSTDGVHDNLTDEQIKTTIVNAPSECAANKLASRAHETSREPRKINARAKPDDITAVVVEI